MEYLQEVRNQYENYPYPYRNPEDEKVRLIYTQDAFLEKINHYCFQGKQSFNNFRALVAGGGTGSAAIFLAEQLRHKKNAEIVYIDISKQSMDVARERAAIRGLDNITWVHNSILDLQELDLGTFDYINCVGVLHHLEDYHTGLRSLGSVLADGGCLGIMVYGKHARAPIYQMQSLMHLIHADEPEMQNRVENTKIILNSLPPSNLYKRNENEWKSEIDEYGDIGLYDLFLHSNDHGFDVLELYDWIENCGFNLVEFIGPKFESKIGYDPKTFIGHPGLLQKIAALPLPRQQAIAELMSGLIQRHSFYLSKKEHTRAQLDNLDNIPFFLRNHPRDIPAQIAQANGKRISLKSPDEISMQFLPGKYTADIFSHLDGERSLKTIFNKVRKQRNSPKLTDKELLDDFRPIYEICNNISWMLLRHSSLPRFDSIEKLQEPVTRKYNQP
ncbi:MAG: methyltransferase [Desulfobulbaceae bacterium]|uniref:Methyltransferase n=1 Tax=Candidatus Desulfobia pelagia TaxID=2841692 RepID=A0A8J6NCL5_9BACT|nr:methyltransferase [Candidatus Desulfobia pelagia]